MVGTAAEPAGDADDTRFAHLEVVAVKGRRPVQALLRPAYAVSSSRHTRHLPHDLDGIQRQVEGRGGS